MAAWPLASFLVRITWRGIPMLMTTLVAPWLTLPLGAFVHDKVNCIDGFDWEASPLAQFNSSLHLFTG